MDVHVLVRVVGSSPLVRGAPSHVLMPHAKLGIIPARAGSTPISRMSRRERGDHPRSCGEHSATHMGCSCEAGSSPLVRGAPSLGCCSLLPIGIIPARAGSTDTTSPCPIGSLDHPRSCGEHSVAYAQSAPDAGSSPLARGALCYVFRGLASHGIIPARAGSTDIDSVLDLRRRDHPRSCGEHQLSDTRGAECKGSSPLVRGAPRVHVSDVVRVGIIPARAGSTTRRPYAETRRQDHPRSCGEHASVSLASHCRTGSSPLVRGAPYVRLPSPDDSRIIPARAGSTTSAPTRSLRAWDHPRSCGEHILWECTECGHEGSSPLVRGAPR